MLVLLFRQYIFFLSLIICLSVCSYFWVCCFNWPAKLVCKLNSSWITVAASITAQTQNNRFTDFQFLSLSQSNDWFVDLPSFIYFLLTALHIYQIASEIYGCYKNITGVDFETVLLKPFYNKYVNKKICSSVHFPINFLLDIEREKNSVKLTF